MTGSGTRVGIALPLLIALTVLVIGASNSFMASAQETEFEELLDSSLSRWTVVDAADDTFRWVDGVLHVTGPAGWLRSDQRYGDFDLIVEFRFLTDAADSGVFFRAIGDTAFVRGWPNEAYQLQMRNPAGESRFPPLGGLFRHGMPEAATHFDDALAREVTLPAGQWQNLEISVTAERVNASINGTAVLSADGIGNGRGFIGLQGETPSLEFRSVRLRAQN